jgi:hypothetical protein
MLPRRANRTDEHRCSNKTSQQHRHRHRHRPPQQQMPRSMSRLCLHVVLALTLTLTLTLGLRRRRRRCGRQGVDRQSKGTKLGRSSRSCSGSLRAVGKTTSINLWARWRSPRERWLPISGAGARLLCPPYRSVRRSVTVSACLSSHTIPHVYLSIYLSIYPSIHLRLSASWRLSAPPHTEAPLTTYKSVFPRTHRSSPRTLPLITLEVCRPPSRAASSLTLLWPMQQ